MEKPGTVTTMDVKLKRELLLPSIETVYLPGTTVAVVEMLTVDWTEDPELTVTPGGATAAVISWVNGAISNKVRFTRPAKPRMLVTLIVDVWEEFGRTTSCPGCTSIPKPGPTTMTTTVVELEILPILGMAVMLTA